MKIIYKFLASVALITSVSACDMNQYPSDSIPYEKLDEVFDTFSEAESFALGFDGYLRGVQQGVYSLVGDIQGDMFNATTGYANQFGAIHTMGASLTPSTNELAALWQGYLALSTQANIFLANVDNVDVEELDKASADKFNSYTGMAYFMRAYAFYNMALKYAPAYTQCDPTSTLGIPLQLDPDIYAQPERATLEESYDQIKADIAVAKALLRGTPATTYGNFYITYDAAIALDSRIQLSLGNYAAAEKSARTIINSGRYTLANTKDAMIAEYITQTKCTESILMSFSSKSELTSTNYLYYGGFVQMFDFGRGEEPIYAPQYLPTHTLVSLYGAKDIRNGVYIGDRISMDVVTSDQATGIDIKFLTKYEGNPSLTDNDYAENYTMPRVFGLPEQYLIAAEACAMSGDAAAAKTYLNTLQTARGAELTTGSIQNIKTEWARETVGEGFRIDCLKRWNDGFSGRVPQAAFCVMTGANFDEKVVDAGYY